MRITFSLAILLLAATPLAGRTQAGTAVAWQNLPATVPELLAVLRTRQDEVRDQLGSGQTSTVYLAAFAAKDVALALEDHLGEIPASSRAAALDAVQRVVLTAWQMDTFAEMGDLEKVTHTHDQFSAAVAALIAAYANR